VQPSFGWLSSSAFNLSATQQLFIPSAEHLTPTVQNNSAQVDRIQDPGALNEEGQDPEHGRSRGTGMNGVIVQFLMNESVQKREDQHPKRRVQKKKDQDHQTGHALSLMMSMHRRKDHDQEVVPGLDQTTMTMLSRMINVDAENVFLKQHRMYYMVCDVIQDLSSGIASSWLYLRSRFLFILMCTFKRF